MKTRTRSAALFMACFLLLSIPAAADWPMLQHDPAHTGFTPEAGPQTDNLLWQWVPDESGPETSRSSPPVSAGRVYTIVQGIIDDNWDLTDGQVVCLDAVTGTEIWRYHRGNDQKIDNHPVVSDGRLYFTATTTLDPPWDGSSSLYCLDAETGTELWAGSIFGTARSMVVGNGIVFTTSRLQYDYYYGIYYYYFRAHDAETGDTLWTKSSDDGGAIRPCVDQDRIYTSGENGQSLVCLDALSGSTNWERILDPWGYSPTFYNGKVYYFVSGEGLMALDPENGETIWSQPAVSSLASIAAAEGQLFLVGGSYEISGTVTAVDAETGAVNWSQVVAEDRILMEPAVAGDKLYVVSNDTALYCLETDTGSTVWSHDTGYSYPSPPSVSDGNLYLASRVGGITCYGPSHIMNAGLTCDPSSGIPPFASHFEVSMTNGHPGYIRRLLYEITVTLANEQYYPNWRRGWQNVPGGETFVKSWWQDIPAYVPLIGVNDFALTVTDVTPPPYNQAPYPPAGDTATDHCTITVDEAP